MKAIIINPENAKGLVPIGEIGNKIVIEVDQLPNSEYSELGEGGLITQRVFNGQIGN